MIRLIKCPLAVCNIYVKRCKLYLNGNDCCSTIISMKNENVVDRKHQLQPDYVERYYNINSFDEHIKFYSTY